MAEIQEIQSRLHCQRSLSDAPDQIPEEAQHLYDSDEKICCPIWSSCGNVMENQTYKLLSEAPDEVSEIYIDDGNDDSTGYKLEARLSTFEVEDGHEGSDYRRHIFTDVQPFGPACDMSIKNGDEIVLIKEDTFGPGITHNEVLQNFRSIKVDGCSKFKMVIRREIVQDCCGDSGWKWIELTTTFTLKNAKDEHPLIVKKKCQTLQKNRFEMAKTSLNLYRVQGTQSYITITNRRIFAEILDGGDSDMTKGLWKHEFVSQGRNNTFCFLVTLCDHTGTWFITADKRGRVIPRKKADMFLITKRGKLVIFQTRRGNYLAYDHDNDQLRLQEGKYFLEEIAVQRGNKGIFKR